MNQIMQKLMLYIMRTTRKQCENLTLDLLQERLHIDESAAISLIDMLAEEHVIRTKYTFKCPECGELNTIVEGGIGNNECQFCSSIIDIDSLIDGATIRYMLDRDDFYEFMQENYKKEYELAKIGKTPISKVVSFSAVKTNEEAAVEGLEKEPRLFISHSTKDVKYVKAFVEFLEALGMPEGSIFCSSVDGYKIQWGMGIYDYLESEFNNSDKELIVLFMLSSNYYQSAACLNEMGAAWILKKDYRSILLPGFQYEKIKGAIDAEKIGIEMGSAGLEMDLNEIKNQFAEIFGFQAPVDSKWDRIRKNFIAAINRAKQEMEEEKEA